MDRAYVGQTIIVWSNCMSEFIILFPTEELCDELHSATTRLAVRTLAYRLGSDFAKEMDPVG